MEIKLYQKQNQALTTPATEVLYGGAAGGGKSYLIRAAAIIYSMEIPNLHVYIFRRTFKELMSNHMYTSGGFLELLEEFIDDKIVKYNKQDYVFEWNNGSRIQLAHAQWESDIYNYQGAQIPLLIIDEATHFTETMIRFIRSRVRLGSLKIPNKYKEIFPRIIYASNPGGVSHRYFKKNFVDFGTRLHSAPKDDGGMLRKFIPALLCDNKILVENDPTYADKLRGLGKEQLVEAMLSGDWNISDTTAIPSWNDANNVCEPFEVPYSWEILRGYDYGFSAPYAVLWYAVSNGEAYIDHKGRETQVPKGSIFIINELYGADKFGQGIKESPDETAKKISQEERNMNRLIIDGPADNAIFNRDRGPSINDLMQEHGVGWVESNKKPGSRVLGLSLLNQMVFEANRDIPERPIFVVMSNCVETIAQLPHLQLSKKNIEDVDTESEDHIYDVVRYIVLHVSDKVQEIKITGF